MTYFEPSQPKIEECPLGVNAPTELHYRSDGNCRCNNMHCDMLGCDNLKEPKTIFCSKHNNTQPFSTLSPCYYCKKPLLVYKDCCGKCGGCCDCKTYTCNSCAENNIDQDRWCSTCDQCVDCCGCTSCSYCGESIKEEDRCSNTECYKCKDHCDCWTCSNCNERWSPSQESIAPCENCEYCEDCCSCSQCDNCEQNVSDVCYKHTKCESCCDLCSF